MPETISNPEEHAAARAQYVDACQRITEARRVGDHLLASKIAHSILPLEDALNAYERGLEEPRPLVISVPPRSINTLRVALLSRQGDINEKRRNAVREGDYRAADFYAEEAENTSVLLDLLP